MQLVPRQRALMWQAREIHVSLLSWPLAGSRSLEALAATHEHQECVAAAVGAEHGLWQAQARAELLKALPMEQITQAISVRTAAAIQNTVSFISHNLSITVSYSRLLDCPVAGLQGHRSYARTTARV